MSALCIGGVCIPYSAILPLLALVVKYLVGPLVKAGLIPEKVAKWFGLPIVDDKSSVKQKELSCTESGESCCKKADALDVITTIRSEEHWLARIKEHHDAMDESATFIFAQFTATWCKPCKKVEPQFRALAEKFSGKHLFVKVDVDDMENLASMYNIVMMPTFLVLRKENELLTLEDKYSGSDERKLVNFVEGHAEGKHDKKEQ